MFDRLFTFLTGADSPTAGSIDSLQVAVAALLVEAARMDTHFDQAERAVIKGLLMARFDLDDGAAERLLEAGTKASTDAVQLFGFTRGLVDRLSYEERLRLIEMLWEVAYADGTLTAEEDSLIRRVAGLIYVTDHDRGVARKLVRERLGMADSL